MANGQSIFLVDSNILVYSMDVGEPEKQDTALSVLSDLDLSKRGVLSVQVLGESFNAVTRRISWPLSAIDAEELVLMYGRMWPVLELGFDTVALAVRISRQNQLSYWDSLLLAMASLNGVSHILSEDLSHGQIVEGVEIINPLLPAFDLASLD